MIKNIHYLLYLTFDNSLELQNSENDKILDISQILQDRELNTFEFKNQNNILNTKEEISNNFNLSNYSKIYMNNNTLSISKHNTYIQNSKSIHTDFDAEFTLSFFYKIKKSPLFQDDFFKISNKRYIVHGISWKNNNKLDNYILLYANKNQSDPSKFYNTKGIIVYYDNIEYFINFDYELYNENEWLHFVMSKSLYKIRIFINGKLYINEYITKKEPHIIKFDNIILGNYLLSDTMENPTTAPIVEYDEFCIIDKCLFKEDFSDQEIISMRDYVQEAQDNISYSITKSIENFSKIKL